ncbi:MAG: hypothetical protein ACI9MR_001270 [Myxococcota bacterium]|jgi:hypothetical protein
MTLRTLALPLLLALSLMTLSTGCYELDGDSWFSNSEDDYDDQYWDDYSNDNYDYQELTVHSPSLAGEIGVADVTPDAVIVADGYDDGYSASVTITADGVGGGSMLILSTYGGDGFDSLSSGVYSGWDAEVNVMGCAGESLADIDMDIEADTVVIDREDHDDGSSTINVTATFPDYEGEGSGEQILTGSVTVAP